MVKKGIHKRYIGRLGKPLKGGSRAKSHLAKKPATKKYKMISYSGVTRGRGVHTTMRLHTTNRKNVNAHYKPKTSVKNRYIGKTTTTVRHRGK